MSSVNATLFPPTSAVERGSTLFHIHPSGRKVPTIVSFLLVAGGIVVISLVISSVVKYILHRTAHVDRRGNEDINVSAALKASIPLQIFSQMKRAHSNSFPDDGVSFSPINTIDSSQASQRATIRNTLVRKDRRTSSADCQIGERRKTFMRQARIVIDEPDEVVMNGVHEKSMGVLDQNGCKQIQHNHNQSYRDYEIAMEKSQIMSKSVQSASSQVLDIIIEQDSPILSK